MHYVCVGFSGAVAIHRGFACTRDELPIELQREARPHVGQLIQVETYSSRQAADAVADMYDGQIRAGRREYTDRGVIHRAPFHSF